jgi:hypothetical protein
MSAARYTPGHDRVLEVGCGDGTGVFRGWFCRPELSCKRNGFRLATDPTDDGMRTGRGLKSTAFCLPIQHGGQTSSHLIFGATVDYRVGPFGCRVEPCLDLAARIIKRCLISIRFNSDRLTNHESEVAEREIDGSPVPVV